MYQKIANFFLSDTSAGGPTHLPGLRLKKMSDALLAEVVYAADRTFDNTVALAVYENRNSHSAIKVFFQPIDNNAGAPIPARLVVQHHEEKLVHNLPEMTVNANYRQIVSHPIYQDVIGGFTQSSKVVSLAGGDGQKNRFFKFMRWLVIVLVVGFIAMWAYYSMVAASVTNSIEQVTQGAVGGNSVAANERAAPDLLSVNERKAVTAIVANTGIQLQAQGSPFIVFSDPHCPACQQLDASFKELQKTDKSLAMIVVPVAFKENSSEAVTKVLCSKDRVVEWDRAITGAMPKAIPSQLCDIGRTSVATNNIVFEELKFSQTPTVVTTSGKILTDTSNIGALVASIKQNSKQ